MTLWGYSGRDASGRAVRGYVEAADAKGARVALGATGVVAENLFAPDFRALLTPDWRMRFYENLGTLLNAGFPVDKAFGMLGEDADTESRGAMMAIGGGVFSGARFADSVAAVAGGLPPFERATLDMADRTGSQGAMLVRLASFMDAERRIRDRIASALAYPAAIFAFAMLMLAVMSFGILPKAASLFPAGDVPESVRMLQRAVPALFLGLAAAVLAGCVFVSRMRRAAARGGDSAIRGERLLLSLPVARRLLPQLWASRYAATMSLLLEAGLAPQDAVAPSGEATGSALVARGAAAAAADVAGGTPLGRAVASIAPVGPILAPWVAVGEKAGGLPAMLGRAAARAGEEFDRMLRRAMGLLEPALIGAVGLVVLLVALAVVRPMLELTTTGG